MGKEHFVRPCVGDLRSRQGFVAENKKGEGGEEFAALPRAALTVGGGRSSSSSSEEDQVATGSNNSDSFLSFGTSYGRWI